MRNRFLICLLAWFGAAGAQAQLPRTVINEVYDPTRKTSKTELRVTPLFDQIPPSGYLPIRVFIINDASIKRTWEFAFTSKDSSYTDEGNELRSRFRVECDPKRDTEDELLVPVVTAFQVGYSTTELLIEVRAPAGLRGSTINLSTFYDERFPAVLVSEELYKRNGTDLSSEAESQLSGRPGGFGPHGYHRGASGIEFGAAFHPKQLSDDWRAYSGFDSCLLTDQDWGDLSSGARTALLRWVRLGGSLVIYSTNPGTDLATVRLDNIAPGRREADLSWGTVRLENLPPGGVLDASDTVDLVMRDIPKRTGGNRLNNLRNDFRPAWPLQVAFGSKTAHILFFILVLIAFGVLVGPVNLFVFARAGQRHRLFVTTPIISLAASLLLVVLILFQDGFGGRGQRVVLMEIGPENTAYLSQEQIARTGVLLKTGFTTPEHGYLSPVMIKDSRWARVTETNQGGDGRYTVDLLENGLKVAGDWFQSRSEHGHLFETIRPTRGRINLIRSGREPVVNSTFEFPLQTLYYLDQAGGLWTGQNIQQGRNTTLQPASDLQFQNWLALEKNRFSGRNALRMEMATERAGAFFATTTEAPGIDTLASINWSDTYTFITGIVANP